jgi:hypothetical protein
MMELLIGIIGGLASFLILESIKILLRKIERGSIAKVFPLKENLITIILAGYHFNPTYSNDLFVHAESIQAVSKLTALFNYHRIKTKFVVDKVYRRDNSVPIEICIGGEGISVNSKFYLDKYCDKQYYGSLHKDEGLIVKLKIPIRPPEEYKLVILLYGYDSNDTEASIAYFSKHFVTLVKKEFKNDNVVIQLRTINEQEAEYIRCNIINKSTIS